MTLRDVELRIQRAATKRFIEADSTDITLSISNKELVGGTMRSVDGGDRDSQTFKLIWLNEEGIYEQPPSGTRRFDFILVGEHDADVAIGDFWKVGKQEFRIEYIYPSNGWEVKAGGVSHGPKPT